MTVSRVVRGDRAVAPGTARRVQQAIEQTGYRSDPVLSALAAYRSQVRKKVDAGLVYLDCEPDAFSLDLFNAACLEAGRLGYAVERHLLPPGAARRAQLCRQLVHRGVRGLLVGPSRQPPEFSRWDWSSFAAVSLSALLQKPILHSVTTDYFSGATIAMEHLHCQGARRIGFCIDAGLEGRTAHRWLGGYLAALNGEQARIYCGDFSSPLAMKRWMKRERLEGLLTIHRGAWEARPSDHLKAVFLSPFGSPSGVPRLVYDVVRIAVEGVRVIHHLYLNHEFGLPAEGKSVNLQPIFQISPD